MRAELRKIISLLTPVLLHQATALAAVFLFRVCADRYGLEYNATLAVLAGNLLVLPIAARMYRRDERIACASGGGSVFEPASVQGTRSVVGKKDRASGDMAGSMEGLTRGAKRHMLLFGAACFIGGGALNVAWSGILNLLHIQAHFSNQTQEQLLAANLLLQIVGLGIAAPVAEELIFRGLTYRRMRRMFPVWAAVVLSALLFAVYHGNPIQMIFAFPMAVVLALVYEHGKLFIFPVLFHMGSNLTAIFLQIWL